MSDLELELNAASSILSDMDRDLLMAEMRATAYEEDAARWQMIAQRENGIAARSVNLNIVLIVIDVLVVVGFVWSRA